MATQLRLLATALMFSVLLGCAAVGESKPAPAQAAAVGVSAPAPSGCTMIRIRDSESEYEVEIPFDLSFVEAGENGQTLSYRPFERVERVLAGTGITPPPELSTEQGYRAVLKNQYADETYVIIPQGVLYQERLFADNAIFKQAETLYQDHFAAQCGT